MAASGPPQFVPAAQLEQSRQQLAALQSRVEQAVDEYKSAYPTPVSYTHLDVYKRQEQEYAVKRLEAALKTFGPGFHVCQYLFKSNRPDIPFAKYDDPIVEAAIDQRRKFFEAKRDHLYQVEIFYCILLEGARSKTGVGAAIARLLRDPAGAVGELRVQFTNDSMKTLLGKHIEHDLRRLDQSVQAFACLLYTSRCV